MASNICRCLVIDACVARAAGGEDAKHPVSRDCRDFLHVMLGLTHKIVKTEEIWLEWKKHKSIYAKKWLNSMIAKKRFHPVQSKQNEKLREYAVTKLTDKNSAAILKDCHLVEAAYASDLVVVSKEVIARKLFSQASESVGWLKTVAWVNPTDQSEKPLEWLQNGAEPKETRCLNNFSV